MNLIDEELVLEQFKKIDNEIDYLDNIEWNRLNYDGSYKKKLSGKRISNTFEIMMCELISEFTGRQCLLKNIIIPLGIESDIIIPKKELEPINEKGYVSISDIEYVIEIKTTGFFTNKDCTVFNFYYNLFKENKIKYKFFTLWEIDRRINKVTDLGVSIDDIYRYYEGTRDSNNPKWKNIKSINTNSIIDLLTDIMYGN